MAYPKIIYTTKEKINPKEIIDQINACTQIWDDKQKLTITIQKYYPKRSVPQHRYYRLIVSLYAQELGWEHDEMHEYLKNKYCPKIEKVNIKTGEIHIVPKSTTKLTTQEMTQLIENTKASAASNGIYLPNPNEQITLTLA